MASSSAPRIREVWADNLEEELETIMELVDERGYTYIAMDTEFPGVVARPLGAFSKGDEYRYSAIRCNVDLLNLIQLGIALFDKDGRPCPVADAWQFNFSFSVQRDLHAEDSIAFLREAGVDFARHERVGIDPRTFSERFIMSGLVLSKRVRWVAFHGSYDFGYLTKLLTGLGLPERRAQFKTIASTLFPRLYDIKTLMQSCDLHGGLSAVADALQIERVGTAHTAGSDAALTGRVFFRVRERYFDNALDTTKFNNLIYGLHTDMAAYAQTPARKNAN